MKIRTGIQEDTSISIHFFIIIELSNLIVDYSKKKFYKILKKSKLDLSFAKYILIRQDPPFNLEYISTTLMLDRIKDKTKIINDPTSIRNVSEKLYSSSFQKYMPNTIFTKDLKELKTHDFSISKFTKDFK